MSFFFYFRCLFFILNDVNRSTDALKVWRGSLGGTTTTTMGPNDASHVVWALGEFFYIFFMFFFVFNDLHRYYGNSKGTVWFNAGNNNNNRPKRRVSRRLGPR